MRNVSSREKQKATEIRNKKNSNIGRPKLQKISTVKRSFNTFYQIKRLRHYLSVSEARNSHGGNHKQSPVFVCLSMCTYRDRVNQLCFQSNFENYWKRIKNFPRNFRKPSSQSKARARGFECTLRAQVNVKQTSNKADLLEHATRTR